MKNSIVCFGEVLWDVFASHKLLGGAPLNVALRLHAFANDVGIISSVGADSDGQEIIKKICSHGVQVNSIQIHPSLKTGSVSVTLNEEGSASYEINKPRAWDAICLNDEILESVKKSDAFIFGSLIARSDISRETLFSLLAVATYKVFDVNLRYPHYEIGTLNELMNAANFIKFNDEELFEITQVLGFESLDFEANIKFIEKSTGASTICVTRGADGAMLYYKGEFYYNKGYQITVVDTVGAGDSFLASLIDKLLKGVDPQKSLDFATAVGAIVASSKGANPEIDDRLEAMLASS